MSRQKSSDLGTSPSPFRRWRRRFFTIFGLVVICCVGGLYWAYYQLLPPARTGRPVDVHVRSGETATQIAQKLEQLGLVRNGFVFRLFLSYTGAGRRIQAGHYQIRVGTSASEIAYQMAGGIVASDAMRVTIPEGFTVVQIAQRLASDGVCSARAFESEVNQGQFTTLVPLPDPHSKTLKYRLEGYLFPDTYEFERGESAHDVVTAMLSDFDAHVYPSVAESAKSQGRTLADVVTEASLIEKEAKVNAERPMIAGVIENRLKRQMKLQIDATLEYIVGHRDVLSDADKLVRDPYNTYLNKGLPPGPISNPGMASILAALHPAHSSFLYYVVRNDGSGRDYFASTYQQHLSNIRKSEENLKHYGR